MRYAIFSDIRNHTTALKAVLNHASQQQIDRYYCLGDVGIDDCVNLVREISALTVFGNWELSGWPHLSTPNQEWVLTLPPLLKEAGFWLTHAAPLWPTHLATLANLLAKRHHIPMSRLFPYLYKESEALWETIASLQQAGIPLLFHGHTHRQMAWCFTADNHLQRWPNRTATLQPGDILIVGVGSVGDPMEGTGWAYAIFDDETNQVELVRAN